MTHEEIALQLTMKAMEENLLIPKPLSSCSSYEEANQFSVEQITECYEKIFKCVKTLK